jgi:hypothetical protein
MGSDGDLHPKLAFSNICLEVMAIGFQVFLKIILVLYLVSVPKIYLRILFLASAPEKTEWP